MKKYILVMSILISIATFTTAQTGKATSKDSTHIIKLENDWAKAMITKDEKVFQKLLADDFFYTENDKMYTRAEVLETVTSNYMLVQYAHNEDMQVHLKHNLAIVTGWLIVDTIGEEAESTFKYRFTDIWLKQNGNWQLIGAHDYLMQQR